LPVGLWRAPLRIGKMSYLFVGEDNLSKDTTLVKIKEEFLSPRLAEFNFDSFSGRELGLVKLQEAFLRLPVEAKKRVILIRGAHQLSQEIKEYLIHYLKKPFIHVLLILDAPGFVRDDVFFAKISRYLKLLRFSEREILNTFKLSQEIDRKRINSGLKMLSRLLLDGEKPERIIGGLRYCWKKNYLAPEEKKRRLRLLLNCDLEIKTGRLRPAFALERLIVNLGLASALR